MPTSKDVRRTIALLLQHTRLCALAPAEFCKEVLPYKILRKDEIKDISLALDCQEQNSSLNLTEICKVTKKRRNKDCTKTLAINDAYNNSSYCTDITLLTKFSNVELLSVEFVGAPKPTSWTMVPEGLKYECKVSIKIYKVDNYDVNSSSEPPREIQFNSQVTYGKPSQIPLNIKLDANTKYTINVKFLKGRHPCISYSSLESSKKVADGFDITAGFLWNGEVCTSKSYFFQAWQYKISD